MTTAVRATTARSRKIIRQMVRTRSDFEAAIAGASKAERSFLRRTIAALDRVIGLFPEFYMAVESLRKLANSKPRKRVRRSARVGR